MNLARIALLVPLLSFTACRSGASSSAEASAASSVAPSAAPTKGGGGSQLAVRAAGAGNIAELEQLLAQGVDLSAGAGKGSLTPLILASYTGEVETVRWLLDQRVDPNGRNDNAETALHTSGGAASGSEEIVKLLVGAGADVEAKDGNGRAPLVVHAQEGHLGAVKILLERKANVDARDKDGVAAIHAASENGHVDVVKALIAAGATIDVAMRSGATALHAAADKGAVDVAKVLLAAGASRASLTKEGFSPLGLAIVRGGDAIVALYDQPGDLNEKAGPPGAALHVAASHGKATFVARFLEQKANVDAPSEGLTPLMHAIVQSHADVVKQLLAAGADPNLVGRLGVRALSIAAMVGSEDIVTQLLDAGAKLEATNPQGGTALRAAADAGKIGVVRLLVKKGANARVVDEFGKQPIDYARENGHVDVVRYLESLD